MLHTQALGQQPVLRLHHVIVVVARELRAQAVGGPGGLPGAEGVGQDEVVAAHVERLARPEQLVGEVLGKHARARAGGAVQDQHRLARRRAYRAVVQLQLGEHLARMKAKVARHPVALLRLGVVRGERRQRGIQQDSEEQRCNAMR